MKPWYPQNWEEACKRNAGRKKLHQRKRKERADRIVRLLAAIEAAPELLESSYGWLALTAQTMKRSRATASRDFQLARRIHSQFARMFGRKFEVTKDQILGPGIGLTMVSALTKATKRAIREQSTTFPSIRDNRLQRNHIPALVQTPG